MSLVGLATGPLLRAAWGDKGAMGIESPSSPVRESRLGLIVIVLVFFVGVDGSGAALVILNEVVIFVLRAEMIDGLEAPTFLVACFGLGLGPVTFDIAIFLLQAFAGSGALSLSLVETGLEDFGRGLGAGVSIEGSNIVFGGNGMTTNWLALTRSTSEVEHNTLSTL